MNKALEILKNIKCGLVHPHHIPYINEAIAELEAQEANSCDGCVHYNIPEHKWQCAIGFRCKKAWKNRYEPKDTK